MYFSDHAFALDNPCPTLIREQLNDLCFNKEKGATGIGGFRGGLITFRKSCGKSGMNKKKTPEKINGIYSGAENRVYIRGGPQTTIRKVCLYNYYNKRGHRKTAFIHVGNE